MGNRFESLFTGNYEADYELIDSASKGNGRFGYEELHITDDLIDAIKNGKDMEVSVQDEYTLRIIYGPKE